jgi:hypothetical protein
MIDCYVLSPVRSAPVVTRFLDSFLPDRVPSFAASDPSDVLGLSPNITLEGICTHLAAKPEAEYTFYWRSTSTGDPLHAIVAFNADGTLVLGLSIACPQPTTGKSTQRLAETWCGRLSSSAATADSQMPLTLWGAELAPPTQSDFASR